MMDDDECGTAGGMIANRNGKNSEKTAAVPLCPLQIPHDLTRARTRAAAVGSQRPTASLAARPKLCIVLKMAYRMPYVFFGESF
jgi:hypothetical protein